jgi:hypothetical protein
MRTDADNVTVLLVQVPNDSESLPISRRTGEPKPGDASKYRARILS